MNALTKVLVVDNGDRTGSDLLSTELAELGFSSVTTSLEAACEVLDVIERPAAIFLNMPVLARCAQQASFRELARSLRCGERTVGVPVIEWDRSVVHLPGGVSSALKSAVGPQALAEPEL